ncbi:MAG: hypothetical protein WBD46_03210 [Acidobacteriaceae bacterium]
MRYFGIFVYGFGFLMSGLFVVLGLLRITSPAKALALDQFFIGKKRFFRVSEKFSQTSRGSRVVLGILTMGFGLFFGYTLLRSLLFMR